MHRGQQFLLMGSLGLSIGAALPWATISSTVLGRSESLAGYLGDGILTGIMGLILLISALSAKGKPGKLYSIAAAVLAIMAGFILLTRLLVIRYVVFDDEVIRIQTGIGVYVSLIGAVLVLVGGLQRVPAIAQPEPADVKPEVTPS